MRGRRWSQSLVSFPFFPIFSFFPIESNDLAADSPKAAEGGYVGLTGKNLDITVD